LDLFGGIITLMRDISSSWSLVVPYGLSSLEVAKD